MNSERLSNFSVVYPQLNYDPDTFKGGRKRFSNYKNKVSQNILAVLPTFKSENKIQVSVAEFYREHPKVNPSNFYTNSKSFESTRINQSFSTRTQKNNWGKESDFGMSFPSKHLRNAGYQVFKNN